MLHNPTSATIRAEWTTAIEAHLEAGLTPVLNLGYSHSVLDGVPAAIALQSLINRRTDVTFPLAVGGGSSPLWLAALLHEAGNGPGRLSPGPLTIFAGADMGTYMASLTTAPRTAEREADLVLPPPAQLPANLRWHFAPPTEPGQVMLWETLSMRIMEGERFAAQAGRADEESAWLLVASLLTVTALILFALIA